MSKWVGMPKLPHRIKKTEFVGKGCFLQGLGLLLPFIGWAFLGVVGAVVGAFAGVALLLSGGRQSFSWRCSECGNPLADDKVRICPVCRNALSG